MTDAGFDVRVVVTDMIAEGIRYIELERVDGRALPDFGPGAHIDLHISPSLVRQYSLCNGPGPTLTYQIAVKREDPSRGGSSAIHELLKVGDVLHVTGPRNHFELQGDAASYLLVGGGIGVTPLLSMARHLRAGDKPFRLDYFSRTAGHTAFADEFALPDWGPGQVALHHGVEPPQLTRQFETLFASAPDGTHVYVCGPRAFMDLAMQTASRFMARAQVHHEYFAADPVSATMGGGAFVVRCARSMKDIDVPPGERIVVALSRHGITVDVMCEQGVCGTCATTVLQGRPDHRDSYLTDEEREEGKTMMVCCSRSMDPLLVLDL